MKSVSLSVFLALAATILGTRADEAAAIAFLTGKGFEISKNEAGQAVRLMSKGGDGLVPADYARIAELPNLEQMGLNAANLGDGEWGFLKSLPKLKQLSIWHGHGVSSLADFSGLKVESLTIGGCMGLRDKNKDAPLKQRDMITTLRDLPNLKRGNWYHSPTTSDDSNLAHIAAQFPTLEDLRLDFAAPRGAEAAITPAGLAVLKKLPLHTLSLENAHTFNAAHFESLAGIANLKTVLIDARRQAMPEEPVAAFKAKRPDVTVVMAGPGAEGPPVAPRPKKN
jgi:hypothetical protein